MSGRLDVWPPLPPASYLRRPTGTGQFPLAEPGVALFARARHGLFLGVRALGLLPGDEILAPAYHHGSEIEALVRAGLKPCFYEASDTLAPDEAELENLLTAKTRGLYLTHYLILDTQIKIFYSPRDSAAELFLQYFGYGRGRVDLMMKHRQPMSLRSLLPLTFVGSLAALTLISLRSRRARALLTAEVAVYGGCAFGFGLRGIARRREPLRLLPTVAAVFPVLHLGYGVGMLRGLAALAAGVASPVPPGSARSSSNPDGLAD